MTDDGLHFTMSWSFSTLELNLCKEEQEDLVDYLLCL
jgi:hypothetical protein